MTHLARIADRVLNRPLLIDPGKAEIILAVLEGRILPGLAGGEGEAAAGLDRIAPSPELNRFVGTSARTQRSHGMSRAAGSTAIITVDGSLVNRGAWIGASSGLTSYEGIGAQIDDAVGDSEIKSILIDMNSFGGEATGMFALAAKVRAAAKKKRVVAVVNDVAASAGYGIVSAAHEIVVSPTSIVGSIGVMMMHLDRSGEMQLKGIRPTFIHAGANKVDGHPFGPLSDDVRASLQQDVDALYQAFVETVAAGRGSRLTASKAKATEAKTFIGQAAVDRGLADRIGTFDEVLAELNRPAASGAGKSKERARMDGIENNTQATGISPDAHNAAIKSAQAAAFAEGQKLGAAEATARIKTILTCEAAKGREATASHLALESSMSADEAVKLLATLPAGTADAQAPKTTQTTAPVLTIDQRAANLPEMGGGNPQQPSAQIIKSGWDAAFARTRAN